MNEIDHRIYFKESRVSNSYELFHKFAENFIFFRWIYFKNRPRSTFLLIRSLLVNSLIFCGYYLIFSHIDFLIMGIEVDPILLLLGSSVVGYWHMNKSFSEKCNYLSSLYNEVIKSKVSGNEKVSLMLELNFSMQLLTMDLWGHRLYSWVLVKTMKDAVKWSLENNKSRFNSFDQFLEAVESKKFEVAEARCILLDYTRYLASSIESSEKTKLNAA